MALKDIFKMTKANRYTVDGREELIKAQEAVTEDRRYKIGEISEKTGLQKTANGWVKPNKGGAGKTESKPAESTSSAPKTESTPEQKNMLDYFKTVKEKVNKEGKGSVPLRDFKKASEIQMAINKYNDWKAGRLTRRGGPDGILEGEALGKALKNDIEKLGLNPSDVIGDSAPRVLTGDTRIRVRK